MKKITVMVAALMLAGCASIPQPKQPSDIQVNRAVKADKYAAPKQVVKAEQPAPNKVIKKRWYDGFRERWLNK